MSLVTRLFALVVASLTAVALVTSLMGSTAAFANTKVTTVYHIDLRYIDSDTCGFDISVHYFGSFKGADYLDNSGFRTKTIFAAFGGLLTITERARGTTLTTQNVSFQEVITYAADGSVSTDASHGVVLRFTSPGDGIVLKDVGNLILDADGNIVFEHPLRQAMHGDVDEFCAAFG
jgi:hypothetical protein